MERERSPALEPLGDDLLFGALAVVGHAAQRDRSAGSPAAPARAGRAARLRCRSSTSTSTPANIAQAGGPGVRRLAAAHAGRHVVQGGLNQQPFVVRGGSCRLQAGRRPARSASPKSGRGRLRLQPDRLQAVAAAAAIQTSERVVKDDPVASPFGAPRLRKGCRTIRAPPPRPASGRASGVSGTSTSPSDSTVT